jgi:hypothetical protein
MAQSKFYQNVYLYLAIGLIVVFWGFSQSYFGKLGQITLPYHIHGISATLWMVLLIVQPFLYRKGKLTIHKYLGWISIIIVPIIVFGGFEMMKLMIQNQENYPPNIVYRLAFIDAFTLFGFMMIYALAIYYRRRLKLHARFMVCTIFGPLVPALTRVFFSIGLAENFNESLTLSYLLLEIVLLFIIWKERNLKEMKLTYLPVFVFMVTQHLFMYFAENWNWWITVMNDIADYH